jgi:glycosyltransferase involved in cell wall biosynthesis
MIVYADLRYPDKTGVGVFKQEILHRAPAWIDVIDLNVKGRIGSPFSPVAISKALARKRATDGIFFSPGFMPPAWCSVPSIVTVHDLQHLHFYSKFHVAYYELILKRLYRRCRNIICVSQHARNEFLNWSGISGDRVVAVHNGVSDVFRIGAGGIGFNFSYIFFPGNHRIYKNKVRLLQAYAASALPRKDVHLVFTGHPVKFLLREAEKCGVSPLLHFMGDVSTEELLKLYKGALLVAYVSLHEGFGLPILEAMAAGVPVLVSNTTAMPEVAGDAAMLVNPYSVNDIIHGLNTLAFDESERKLRTRLGMERARSFTWDAAAEKIWAVIAAT